MNVTTIAALLLMLPALALAGEYSRYAWTSDLPPPVATLAPAASRTARAVDELFALERLPLTLDIVIANLGRPDGFSRQSLYSKAFGSSRPQKEGGTLRFKLNRGGELLVRTGDFRVIFEAIRYDKKGDGTLLQK